MVDESGIHLRFTALDPVLDARGRRHFAAAEARTAGHGGIAAVARITGLARSTIGRGLAEIRDTATDAIARGRTRRPGGGRQQLTDTDATLLADLQGLVEPTTRGDPQAALATGQPAISVDTKKKELVGDFKNAGRELRPKGQPESERVHDFKIPNSAARYRMGSMTSPATPVG